MRKGITVSAIAAPVALVIALLVAAFGPFGRAGAQDEAALHPAHIHSGSCAELGDVVFPLSPVGSGLTEDGTPVAAGEMAGSSAAIPVEISVTAVAAPLADILAADHAINVHLSPQEAGTYIACGDVGGQQLGDTLVIGLHELNDSGFAGVAVLEAGDSQTTVTVYLIALTPAGPTDDTEGTLSAAGTPAVNGDTSGGSDTGAAGSSAAVEIVNFAYSPDPLEIAVGTEVTWTNQDADPHTATSRDRTIQSGTLNQGESFSYTFTDAGTYDIVCEFHANMHQTVTVS